MCVWGEVGVVMLVSEGCVGGWGGDVWDPAGCLEECDSLYLRQV